MTEVYEITRGADKGIRELSQNTGTRSLHRTEQEAGVKQARSHVSNRAVAMRNSWQEVVEAGSEKD